MFMVMEYLDRGSVGAVLGKSGPFSIKVDCKSGNVLEGSDATSMVFISIIH